MEDFARLFGGLLAFIYHCFDRVVILGHLPLLTRPENIVHFFRDVHGVRAITKEVLRQRTIEYSQWVEAFTRKHQIPIEWAAKGVRKEDSSPLAADGAAQPRRRISSSRAWRTAPASARPCRSIPPPIRTTASSAGSARVRHPGVTVTDGRGKEFDEAAAGALALGADDGRQRFQAGTD